MSNPEPEHRASTAALVPQVVAGGQTLVRPIAGEHEIVDAFNAYQHLCETLLAPADHQQIGNKSFRKKSAWRKLAVAMGVSCEIVDRQYERVGGRIVRAEIVVRATAPNGRSWEGLGACDLYEKCCIQPCSKRSWNNHTCCTADCTGARHFSNPQHDLPATAATRATNRACADLFGFGEVSAEEIIDRGDGGQQSAPPAATEWESIGWRSKRDHDAARTALVDVLRALPEDQQRRFRLWRESQDPPLDLQQPLDADRMESAAKLAKLLTDGKVQIDDEGTVSLVDEEPAPSGDAAKPETAAETPPTESGTESAPEPPSAGDGESGADPAESEQPPTDSAPAEQPPAGDGDDDEPCPACLGGAAGRIDPDCWGCDGRGTVSPTVAGEAAKVIAAKQQQTAHVGETDTSSEAPCSICGSTRSKRLDAGGRWRCENGTDCRRRVEKARES